MSPTLPDADDAEDEADSDEEHDAIAAQRIEALRALGLVASDVAYPTWRFASRISEGVGCESWTFAGEMS